MLGLGKLFRYFILDRIVGIVNWRCQWVVAMSSLNASVGVR